MMKRLNNNLWHLSLALPCMLLAVGCDNNTTPEVESNEPIELQINPTVALTRGVIQGGSDNGFPDNTSISVYATGTTYGDGNNFAVYTLSSSSWGNNANDKILLSNEAATIYAYYPSTSSKPTDSKISIDILEGNDGTTGATATTITAVDNSSGAIAAAADEKDYMYATAVSGVTNKSNNSVTLNMNHALAMISFCPKLDASYKGTGKLTKIQLKDINQSGTTLGKSSTTNGSELKMKITDGSIEGTPVDANYVRIIKGTDGTSDFTVTTSTSNKFSMLVLPIAATIENNIQAIFTIDNADYEVTLKAPSNGSDNAGYLLAGNNYTYNVTLKGTGLAISSVTVAAWTDGTFGTGDDNLEIN